MVCRCVLGPAGLIVVYLHICFRPIAETVSPSSWRVSRGPKPGQRAKKTPATVIKTIAGVGVKIRQHLLSHFWYYHRL